MPYRRWDAGANAKAGDQTERCEERNAHRERLRQGEDAVEQACDDEHLLTTDLVGEDTAACATKNHAEQAPRGQRAHCCALDTEGSGEVGVGGVDDHEIIAIEDVGQAKQNEHQPGVAVDAERVDNLGDGVLFAIGKLSFAH